MKKLIYIVIIASLSSCQKELGSCYECVKIDFIDNEWKSTESRVICNTNDSIRYINNNTEFICIDPLGEDVYTKVKCK